MTDPVVSIVTSTFNRASLLSRVWKSIRNESISFEWVVVDDGSTDSTPATICGFCDPRIIFLRLEQNQGINIARNTGMRAARGRFIIFLDSDDELAPNALEEAVHRLDVSPPEIGAILMIAQPTFTRNHRETLEDGAILDELDLVVHNRLQGDRAVIYKAEVFRNQMLPEEYRGSEYVFVFGISRWWKYLVVNKPLTLVHRQGDNLSDPMSIVRKSSGIAKGWEKIIQNHAQILSQNASARIRIYRIVLYRHAVAGDWAAVQRVFKELRRGDSRLSIAIKATMIVSAGVVGCLGGDYLRLRFIRMREKGFLHRVSRAPELG